MSDSHPDKMGVGSDDAERTPATQAAPPPPSPWLTGCPQLRVGISQIFGIADLLTEPPSERARAFHETLTERAKMNRMLSGSGPPARPLLRHRGASP